MKSAHHSGKISNANGIAQDVGCDSKTVKSYFKVLESTYLGFFLPSFHLSVRKSQKYKPKFYYFDLGVKRALDLSLDSVVTPGTSGFGEAFEHWVIPSKTE